MNDSIVFSEHKKEEDDIFGMPAFGTTTRGIRTSTVHNYAYNHPDTKTYLFKNFNDMCFSVDDGVPVPLPIKYYDYIDRNFKKQLGVGPREDGVLVVKYIYLDLVRDAIVSIEYLMSSHELRYDIMKRIMDAVEAEASMVTIRLVEFIPIKELQTRVVYNSLAGTNIVLGHPNRYRTKHDKPTPEGVENLSTVIQINLGDVNGNTKWINIGDHTYPIQPNKRTPGSNINITSNGFSILRADNIDDLTEYGIYDNEHVANITRDRSKSVDGLKLALEEKKLKFEHSKLTNDVKLAKMNYKTKILNNMESTAKLRLEQEKNAVARLNFLKSAMEVGIKIFSALDTLLKSK